jgi:RsiW-degrading membrane proteinase PrsW (M82 family)
MDKVEKEPVGLIFKLIIYGVISCIAAAYAEQIASSFLPVYQQGSFLYAVQTSFLLAAFWEELLKYLALRIGSWKNKHFNYRFDGIVYGVSAAVGFAMYENINYVAMFGFATGLTRAFTAVPLHAFCGLFMGVMYSYSKKAAIMGKGSARTLCTVLSLAIPMLIHGVYDTLAMWNIPEAKYGLYVFLIILYIVGIRVDKRMSAEDKFGGFYPQARVIQYDNEITE